MVAHSAKRPFSFAGSEVYDFSGTVGGFALSDTQEGVEVTYRAETGLRAAAGWVNGSADRDTGSAPGDFYLRLANVFGAGEGQVAGQRLGAVYYSGNSRPAGAVAGPEFGFDRWARRCVADVRQHKLPDSVPQGH